MGCLARISLILRRIPLGRKLWAVSFLAVGIILNAMGGALLTDVQRRQNAACEVAAVFQNIGNLSEFGVMQFADGQTDVQSDSTAVYGQSISQGQILDAAARMDGILEVTRAWSMPGRIIYGDYQAEVNLVGLSPEYLQGEWIIGGTFSEDSAMPQCVLSTTAAQAFRDGDGKAMKLPLDVDWTSAQVEIDCDSAVNLRVTGVLFPFGQSSKLQGESGEASGQSSLAEVFMSSQEVRRLAVAIGSGSTEGELRLLFAHRKDLEKNLGALARLGIKVASSDGQEATIAQHQERARLYLVCGGVCIAAAVVLMYYLKKLYDREKNAFEAQLEVGIGGGRMEDFYNCFSRVFASNLRQCLFSTVGAAVIIAVPVIIGISGSDQILDAVRKGTKFSYGFPLQYVLDGLGGDATTFLIPLLSALPSAAGYVDDLKCGVIRLILTRSTKKDYLLGKIISSMAIGGLIMGCGIAISAAAALALLQPLESPTVAVGAMSASSAGAAQLGGLAIQLLWKSLLCILSGMVWAGFGMLASSFIGSRYVAYLAPFILYYLLVILCERYITGVRILYPKEWLSPGGWWPLGNLGAAAWLLELAVLIVLGFLVRGMKRLESI